MEVTRTADMKAVGGPVEYFTGKVTISGQFQRPNPSRVGGAIVHFEPGARTAWHTHPAGQTLIVTDGIGWTQGRGRPEARIPCWRHPLVPRRAQALARRYSTFAHDPRRYPGGGKRHAGDVDGEGHGRAVPFALGSKLISRVTAVTGAALIG